MTLIQPKSSFRDEAQFLVSKIDTKIDTSDRQPYPNVHIGNIRPESINLSRSSRPNAPTIRHPTINEFGETGLQPMSWKENEIKAFKRITWEPGNFKDLTIIYQPGAHVADIE